MTVTERLTALKVKGYNIGEIDQAAADKFWQESLKGSSAQRAQVAARMLAMAERGEMAKGVSLATMVVVADGLLILNGIGEAVERQAKS